MADTTKSLFDIPRPPNLGCSANRFQAVSRRATARREKVGNAPAITATCFPRKGLNDRHS